MNRFVVALGICVLLGAGCFGKNASQDSLPTLDAINFTVQNIALEQAVSGTGGCAISVEYPRFTETMGATEKTLKQMNDVVEDVIARYLDDGKYATLEEAADAFLQECVVGIGEFASVDNDPYDMTEKWTTDISFEVKRNTRGQFSLGLSNYYYMGGAHPNATSTYLTFDLKNGEILGLDDVLTDEAYSTAANVVSERLTSEYGDALYPAELDAFQYYLDHKSVDEAKEILHKYGEFSLTNDGLMMHYDAYEIAPYAAGPIDVEVTL